jgi:hypothetical protein
MTQANVRSYRGSVITENATGELAGLGGLLAVFEFLHQRQRRHRPQDLGVELTWHW